MIPEEQTSVLFRPFQIIVQFPQEKEGTFIFRIISVPFKDFSGYPDQLIPYIF